MRLFLLLLALGLSACEKPSIATAPPYEPVESGGLVDSAAASLQTTILEVQNDVQEVSPEAIQIEQKDSNFEQCTVNLITRWEVSGIPTYNRKWQGVYYPGGSSGPTWGIGWDGGNQTQHDNTETWREHPDVTRLTMTSGVIGVFAKQRISEWSDIHTPYPYAAKVFAEASLPSYTAAARRALGPGFVLLPSSTRCALVSIGYNRGWMTTGPRRLEIRNYRDVCMKDLPTAPACIARETRAMKRLWPTVPGLQARREDEARIAESI